MQAALAEAQQGQAAAEQGQAAAESSAGAAVRAWAARAKQAEAFIAQLERDIAVGLIRSVDEVGALAHAYRPPGDAAAAAAFLRTLGR